MKKPNYTPGPWVASKIEEGSFNVFDHAGLVHRTRVVVPIVVMDHSRDGSEQFRTVTIPANAQLIAAAPSLAESLHELLNATALQDEISEEREAAIKALKLAGWTDD